MLLLLRFILMLLSVSFLFWNLEHETTSLQVPFFFKKIEIQVLLPPQVRQPLEGGSFKKLSLRSHTIYMGSRRFRGGSPDHPRPLPPGPSLYIRACPIDSFLMLLKKDYFIFLYYIKECNNWLALASLFPNNFYQTIFHKNKIKYN